MMWRDYALDDRVLKTDGKVTLWHSDKGIVEIEKNALALSILFDGKRKGYVFHGNGKLILDTIIETDKGAIGRPVEKEINAPFLMIGKTEEIEQKLVQADNGTLTSKKYEDKEAFRARAEELCRRFFGKRRMHVYHCCDGDHGFVFAFSNDTEKLDILVAKENKIVYKAKDTLFVSNEDKVVLKTPFEVILANDRKSCILKRGHSSFCCSSCL